MRIHRLPVIALTAALIAAGGVEGPAHGGQAPVRACADVSDETNPAVRAMVDAMQAEAKNFPQQVNLTVQYTSGVEDQISKMETMIAQHCDVIGLHPRDAKAVTPVIKKAHDQGVHVVLLIDDVPGALDQGIADQFISGDEEKGGYDLGAWLATAHPQGGEYAIITGEPGNFSAIYRSKGFTDAAAKNSAWKKVAEATANWRRDQALTVATNMLTAHPNLSAIFANNDEEAFGALQAIKARNRFGKVTLIGYNGTCIGIQATYQGNFQADGILPIPEFGKYFIDSAVKVGKGEKLEKRLAPPIVPLTSEDAKAIKSGAKQANPPSLKQRIEDAAGGKC
jgi:ABC-type sugar transport system substrate-binding protein